MSVSHSASADQLEATLRILRSEDVTQVLPRATENIDGWIQMLRASGETAHATIAADLVRLKGFLAGTDPNPISDVLQTLAEHIHSFVDDANPRFIESLDQLSKQLTDVARNLQTARDAQQEQLS
ncbi:hypothetical protein HNQ93_000055 [Hymenobacter luteus]|uniref:Uncharacterized protein n=2 Tax=Hymenobacter TaxID=89966 RepID=A0A7W9SXJ0_9BACT|nr:MULTISPECIES: hypothetical protein [Hymenobacter]MBB4600465.1 hypothetical protein [Hymenobacter latericoloratus]MBB6057225.1 hypothetical protein [Hymenobacter luteus]